MMIPVPQSCLLPMRLVQSRRTLSMFIFSCCCQSSAICSHSIILASFLFFTFHLCSSNSVTCLYFSLTICVNFLCLIKFIIAYFSMLLSDLSHQSRLPSLHLKLFSLYARAYHIALKIFI